jgi:hypothetical protein
LFSWFLELEFPLREQSCGNSINRWRIFDF